MDARENARHIITRSGRADHIPLGDYMIDCDTAAKVLGRETLLRDRIGMQLALWDGRRDEIAAQLKEDSVELYRKLPMFEVLIHKVAPLLPPRGYRPPKVRKLDDVTYELEDGRVYRTSALSNDITLVFAPPREAEVGDYPPDDELRAPDESVFEVYDYFVERIGDRYMFAPSGGFSPMVLPGDMESALSDYALRPELIRAACDWELRHQNHADRYYIRGGDGVWVEQDFSSTRGPLISPAMFREFCLPAMKARIAHIKRYRDQVFLHACGNNRRLLELFVEAGVDGCQSLQTGADMRLGDLMRDYGDKLCFWGGVAVENLISGTPEDVRRDVRSAFEQARGAGFILGPSHSVAYGTKYENFMAMLEEHDKLKYSIG